MEENKPCPFCNGNNLEIRYDVVYGHGDSGFNSLRVECLNCSGAKGDISDYGRPTKKDIEKTWKMWNERN